MQNRVDKTHGVLNVKHSLVKLSLKQYKIPLSLCTTNNGLIFHSNCQQDVKYIMYFILPKSQL